MRVCVIGCTFHLGPVFAACLAELEHDVVGVTERGDLSSAPPFASMSIGRMPVAEPGLSELVVKMIAAKKLRFTDMLADAVPEADVVIVAWDTPVDDLDRADPEFVIRGVADAFPYINPGTLVIVSSQLPVGSVARLERMWAEFEPKVGDGQGVRFACVPENLRLGSALESFRNPQPYVAGVRRAEDKAKLESLIGCCISMSVESAEMVKHSRNIHLAAQITLTNEIASMCEKVGASAREVERGLRADKRMGACLRPGEAIAGGTLLRDIGYLGDLAAMHDTTSYVTSAIKKANDHHLAWTKRALLHAIAPLAGKTVQVWGLTYKTGTSTTRRSASGELCEWIVAQGARVDVYEPSDAEEPYASNIFRIESLPALSAKHADAVVVCTPHKEFRDVNLDVFSRGVAVIDPAGWCWDNLRDLTDPDCPYYCVGEEWP